MEQPDPSNSSAAPNLSQSTTHFLNVQKAFKEAMDKSLEAENRALHAELKLLIGPDPPIGVDPKYGEFRAAANVKIAKKLDKIMQKFDREVGRADERQEVERKVERGLHRLQGKMAQVLAFRYVIAQYKDKKG